MLADSMFIRKFGWKKFVDHHLGKGNLGPVESIQHPARNHLSNLKHDRVLVTLTTPPWTKAQNDSTMDWGPHQSVHDHTDFLSSEFQDMHHDTGVSFSIPWPRLCLVFASAPLE